MATCIAYFTKTVELSKGSADVHSTNNSLQWLSVFTCVVFTQLCRYARSLVPEMDLTLVGQHL